MFHVFTLPIPVRTPHGKCLARYGIAPTQKGDPWWVIYRDKAGRWLTTMVEDVRTGATAGR